MDGQKEKDFACCAHSQVIPMRIENKGTVYEEQWRCKDCGAKFVTLDSLFAGPQTIQVMEPVKTLRDEIAIEMLKHMIKQTLPISQDTDFDKILSVVSEHCYKWANAMMEARK